MSEIRDQQLGDRCLSHVCSRHSSLAQKRKVKLAKSIKFLSCILLLDLQNDLVILLLKPAHLEQTRMITGVLAH